MIKAALHHLTRYRYNNSPLDIGGRYLYLRDNKSGKYWSPSWMPTKTKLDEYECRQGQGYTIITSKLNGIKSFHKKWRLATTQKTGRNRKAKRVGNI